VRTYDLLTSKDRRLTTRGKDQGSPEAKIAGESPNASVNRIDRGLMSRGKDQVV